MVLIVIMELIMSSFEYVKSLTSQEKVLFIRMIIALIGEDDEVDVKERNFIKEISRQYKISKSEFDLVQIRCSGEELINEAADVLDRNKSLFLIKELLTVANTDNNLDDREIDFIIQLSTALNIEDEKIMEINQLVLDQINLLERYHVVMEV